MLNLTGGINFRVTTLIKCYCMYNKLKFLLPCFFIILSSIHAENFTIVKDTTLNKFIAEKVILPNYEKRKVIILRQVENFDAAAFLERDKQFFPSFFEYLHSDFNLSTISLKEIVNKHQYSWDGAISEKYPNLSLIKAPEFGISIESLKKLRKDNEGASIITRVIVLLDEQKGKCLIYYHTFQGGGTVVFLEKKNTIWQVVTNKSQFLE